VRVEWVRYGVLLCQGVYSLPLYDRGGDSVQEKERERVRRPPLVVVVVTALLLRGLVRPIAQSA